jgi:hypothetical protein
MISGCFGFFIFSDDFQQVLHSTAVKPKSWMSKGAKKANKIALFHSKY